MMAELMNAKWKYNREKVRSSQSIWALRRNVSNCQSPAYCQMHIKSDILLKSKKAETLFTVEYVIELYTGQCYVK